MGGVLRITGFNFTISQFETDASDAPSSTVKFTWREEDREEVWDSLLCFFPWKLISGKYSHTTVWNNGLILVNASEEAKAKANLCGTLS